MEDTDTQEELSSKTSEKQIEIDKMRNALKSIACEMQRYQESDNQLDSSAFGTPDSNETEKVLSELLKCKTNIKCKKHRIQKLRNNLRTACFVAKTIASAKGNESGSLKHDLDNAQNECADLKEKDKNNTHIINNLSRENSNLREKLNRLANFIRLGYKELQKMRPEFVEETSVLVQLRRFIVSCGEYYADYCNEHDKFLHLKQRNRFLHNKITFLEKHINALSEQLKTLKYRNSGLQKDNDVVKNKGDKSKSNDNNVKVSFTEVKMKMRDRVNKYTNNGVKEIDFKNRPGEFDLKLDPKHALDLSPHLSLVKKLLTDQDTLLQDLKMLSQEFMSNNTDDE